jgi:hypothetical protein
MDGYTLEPKIKEKRWSKDFELEMYNLWDKEDWAE